MRSSWKSVARLRRAAASVVQADRSNDLANFALEALENRRLLCGILGHHDSSSSFTGSLPMFDTPPQQQSAALSAGVSAAQPLLSSNPSATAKLYLDFDGYSAVTWGSYNVPATPEYNIDSTAGFSAQETSNITEIWERVAEKFAPFNIDVTTAVAPAPASLVNQRDLVAVVGGSGGWLGQSAGGVAYVSSFSNSLPNQVWIFPNNLGGGFPKYIAEAAAHESGHALGLQHQSKYSGTTKTAEYSNGSDGGLTAPIMGDSYSATRGLWWNGPSSTGWNVNQNDLAVITGGANGFTYRVDDRTNSTVGATALTVVGGQVVSGAGIIEQSGDVDYFTFNETTPGAVTLSVSGPQGAMLNARLELRNSGGTLIASANTNSLNETITTSLAAGTYYLVVAGAGNYGDIGGYTISGTINGLTDGQLDSAFDGDGRLLGTYDETELGWAVAVQSDGKVFVGGESANINSGTGFDFFLARYNANGTLDTGFGGGGTGFVVVDFGNQDRIQSLAIQSDGKIVAAGVTGINGGANFAIARFTSAGLLDGTFDGDGKLTKDFNGAYDAIKSVKIQSDGKIVVAGTATITTSMFALARYTALGAPDTMFDGDGFVTTDVLGDIDQGWDMALQPDGKMVVVGHSSTGTAQFSVARYNTNGSLDGTFDGDGKLTTSFVGGSAGARAVEIQPDGRIVVGGLVSGSTYAFTRYNTDGTPDSSFDGDGKVVFAGTAGEFTVEYGMALQNDGRIVFGGYNNDGGTFPFTLVRLDSDGAIDNSFGTNGKVMTSIPPAPNVALMTDLAVQADGKIITTGYAFYNSNYHVAVARFTNNTVPSAPSAPSSLTGIGVSGTRIDIFWSDNSNNESGFKIERSLNGTTWAQIATADPNAQSYTDNAVTAATLYYYRVRATNAIGDSAYSNVASTRALINAPTNLITTPVNNTQIKIDWTDNSTQETGFKIERSTDGNSWTQIATVGANVKTYTTAANSLTPNTQYFFRVRAYNATVDSPYSNAVTGTTYALATPTSLAAAVFKSNQINLTWTDTTTTEDGFRIERSTDNINFTQIGTNAANVTTFSATGLTPNTKYYFRVRASLGAGFSNYSNVPSATTTFIPNAPTALTTTTFSNYQINLAWTDNATNESGSKIERGTDGVNFVQIATVGANVKTYSNTGLAFGTKYYYRVRSYNSTQEDSGYSNTQNTTTFSNPPAAPTALGVTIFSSTQLNLAWTDASTDENGFKVERSTDGVNFTQVGTTATNVKTYSATGLSPNTLYYFRVRANHTVLGDSAASNIASNTTYPVNPPASLVAAVASSTSIKLTWQDKSTDETGFRIEQGTDGINFGEVGTAAANALTYTATGLSASTKYYFRIRAYNGLGNSPYTSIVNATTTFIPNAPTALTTTTFSNYQINLAWTDNATNESGSKIERGTDGVNFVQIATVGANVKTYSNTGLAFGTKYYYRVRSYNSTQEDSGYSNTQNTTTFSNPPAAPTALGVTIFSSTQLNLAWTDASTDENGFKVERSTDGVNFTQVGTTATNVKTYSATGLSPNTLYYFRVRAFHTTLGDSNYSNAANNTTFPVNPPAALALSVVSSTSINLTWQDKSTDESGFKVERSTDGVNFTEIAQPVPNTLTYTATGLTPNTKYYFRVRAYNGLGNSPYTLIANATTTFIPNAPTGLAVNAPVVTADSNTILVLTWTDNSTNETGFKIERGTDGVNFTQVATVAANIKTYTNTGLTPNTTYHYRVRANNSTQENSGYTNNASKLTTNNLPAAPTGLLLTVSSSTAIALAWTDAANNETGYKIERGTDGVNFTQIATVGANIKAYSSSGLTGGTKYYYRVRANNLVGDSGYSNINNATTKPANPASLAAVAVAGAKINLTWGNVTGETNFYIERSLNGSTWAQITTVGADVLSYQDSGLTAGTRYYYRIRAGNGSGFSGYSNVVNLLAIA